MLLDKNFKTLKVEASPKAVEAPAVISDTLPGGPRWMHNLGPTPVWIETTSQFNRELEARGLVLDVRTNHAKVDRSPWATKTRLRPGERDPFIHGAAGASPPPDQDIDIPGSTNTPERTTATLGKQEEEVRVEGIQLSLDQLRIMREYGRFITHADLEGWYYCKRCVDFGDMEGTRCMVEIQLDVVFVACRCCMRFGRGATALSPRMPVPQPPSYMEFALGIPEIVYPESVVSLFQRFEKQFLEPLGLIEALRCMVCYHADRQDGIDPGDGGSSFQLKCRCQKRVRRGITV